VPYTQDQCYLCWLYHNHPGYRRRWDGEEEQRPVISQGTPPRVPTSTGPSWLQVGFNFALAMAKAAANGFKTVSPELFEARLAACQDGPCPHLNGVRCLHQKCGCFVNKKAALASEDCPIGRWPKLPITEGEPPM
jgi:hypothetical protein